MKLRKFVFIFFMIFSCNLYSQVNSYSSVHPFSGKVVFSGEFGFTHSYTDYLYSVPKLLSKGTIEFYLPVKSSNALGLKVSTGLGYLNAYGRNDEARFNHPNFNTNLFLLGAGVSFAGKLGYSIPYFSANVSHFRINPQNNKGDLLPNNLLRKYNQNLMLYTFEFGLRFLVQDFWSFNMGMNWNLVNSDYVDDLKANEQNDKYVSLFFGISFYYGGNKNIDSDGDGVIDCKDACPSTPKGVPVDEFGCAIKKNKQNKNVVLKFHKVKNKNRKPESSDKLKPKKTKKNIEKTNTTKKVTASGKIAQRKIKTGTVRTKEIQHKSNVPNSNKKRKFKKIKYSYKFSSERKLRNFFFTDGNLYCFQVAEFDSMNEAKKFAKKLNKAGHHSFIMRSVDKENNITYFKVRIGFFKTLDSAKKYKKKIKF